MPKMATRIYKVEHEEMANGVEEYLTLDNLHCHLGHISLDTARKLVREKMVTGIHKYTLFGRPFFCASCVYAKATWKPVAKMREGERADVFGGELHSDVWGPVSEDTSTHQSL